MAKTTTNGEAPVSTSVDSADSGKEILALWEAINEIKALISFQKTNINPINQEAATEKDTAVTKRIKQSENENVKLTDELRLTNRHASVCHALVEVGRGSSSIYPLLTEIYPHQDLIHSRLS